MTNLSVLKIDLDPGDPVYALDHVVGLLQRANKRAVWLMQERSRSGKGWHLWLKVRPACADLMEVVALQAILGSDRYREANNVCRVRTLAKLPRSRRAFWRDRLNVLYAAR